MKKNMSENDSDEYEKKRQSNNKSVKECRERQKKKMEEAKIDVETFRVENENLKEKYESLTKELNLYKSLFTQRLETVGSSSASSSNSAAAAAVSTKTNNESLTSTITSLLSRSEPSNLKTSASSTSLVIIESSLKESNNQLSNDDNTVANPRKKVRRSYTKPKTPTTLNDINETLIQAQNYSTEPTQSVNVATSSASTAHIDLDLIDSFLDEHVTAEFLSNIEVNTVEQQQQPIYLQQQSSTYNAVSLDTPDLLHSLHHETNNQFNLIDNELLQFTSNNNTTTTTESTNVIFYINDPTNNSNNNDISSVLPSNGNIENTTSQYHQVNNKFNKSTVGLTQVQANISNNNSNNIIISSNYSDIHNDQQQHQQRIVSSSSLANALKEAMESNELITLLNDKNSKYNHHNDNNSNKKTIQQTSTTCVVDNIILNNSKYERKKTIPMPFHHEYAFIQKSTCRKK